MRNSRRRFFTSLLVALSGGSLLSLSGRSCAEPASSSSKAKVSSKGYQVTDHVKAYYNRTNF